MNQTQFLSAFEDLQSDVQELKTLQQRTLLYLEKDNSSKTEIPLLIEERISVKETCQILGCSEVTLWKLRKDGTLPYTRHKRTIRFKKIDILNYLNQKR
nr:helix-turn-helix domain-containing protein [uncultured Flavobacterium sp.]|tara:strand:+ start:307 stop:603 length:297 start_codon:yes stop_codon:yes gene_type:complete